MTRPKVCIFNVETQEEVVREMNDIEYEQHLIDKAQGEIEQAKINAKKAAKAEALAALGLSQEVVNLLAE